MANKNIGLVYEIPTPEGLAYVQHTHDHSLMGPLVRVIAGMFSSRPADLCQIAEGPTRFVAFYPVRHAARDGLAVKVAHCEVPPASQQFPTMIWATGNPKGDKPRWLLWNGERELSKPLDNLTPEQRRLPHVSIVNHATLVEWLASDWSWEHETDFQESPSDEAPIGGVTWPVRHFLYFPDEQRARGAGRKATAWGGLLAEIDDVDGRWGLTVSTNREGLEEDLYSLADEFGGEYDGSEVELS